jgi:hypothetical protein
MAIQTITTDKYLIFICNDKVNYVHNQAGQNTSYNDECYTIEEFTIEQDWLDRLLELGITIE